MGDSLKNKTVKGAFWSTVENFASLGVSFVFSIILARLLSPSDYGTIALITVFMSVANSFVNSGFGNALVRKYDRTEVDNSTAFYFNIIVGVVCYILLFFAAPFIAAFFKIEILTPIIRVMAINVVVSSLCIVQQALLTIRIDFKTQAKISVISNVLSGVLGIVLAYNGLGVWALVFQSVLAGILRMCLLWWLAKWRPTEKFSKESFNSLFSYGSKLLVSGLIDTIYVNVYPLVIGKLFSASTLGLFGRAKSYADLPSSNLTVVMQRVTFPVLSQIQNEDERLQLAYRRILKISAFVIFPLMMLLSAIADPFVRLLITDKWAGCIILLQILCFSKMWYPIHAINLNLLQVKGRSDLFLKLEIVKKVLGILIICITYRFGIVIMCLGQVLTSIFCLVINTYYTGKLINLGFFKQMWDLTPVIITSAISAVVAYGITFLSIDSHLAILLIASFVWFVIYVGINYVIKSNELKEIIDIIKRK